MYKEIIEALSLIHLDLAWIGVITGLIFIVLFCNLIRRL
jgi:hypothetical protein